MKCQNCGVNRATINVAMQINNERRQLHVCHECFEDIKSQFNAASNIFFQDGFFSNPFFFQGQMGGFQQGGATVQTKHGNRSGGLLDELGTNLTELARSGKIDPIIGRDEEIKRTI